MVKIVQNMNPINNRPDEVVLARLGATIVPGGDKENDDSLPPTVQAFGEAVEKAYEDPKAKALMKDLETGKISREEFQAQMVELFGEHS